MATVPMDKKLETLQELLNRPFFPENLETRKIYSVETNDHVKLKLVISDEGDVSIWINGETARFETKQGGGRLLKVRAAMLYLVEAVEMENEE